MRFVWSRGQGEVRKARVVDDLACQVATVTLDRTASEGIWYFSWETSGGEDSGAGNFAAASVSDAKRACEEEVGYAIISGQTGD